IDANLCCDLANSFATKGEVNRHALGPASCASNRCGLRCALNSVSPADCRPSHSIRSPILNCKIDVVDLFGAASKTVVECLKQLYITELMSNGIWIVSRARNCDRHEIHARR